MAKDWIYLFIFNHSFWNYIILLISITLSFSLVDMGGASNGYNLIHNFTLFVGLTFTEDEMAMRFASNFYIQILENIPQFIVVIREMFQFRNTVMFIQAGNPLFAVCMMYKLLGPILGQGLQYERNSGK